MDSKRLLAAFLVVATFLGMAGLVLMPAPTVAKTTVNEQGSDSMLQLMTLEAEAFNIQSHNCSVQIGGGGTGVGIAGLINKQVPIIAASRVMTQSEIARCKANGVDPVMFNISIDAIAIIVHNGNPANNMTLDQIKGIFDGTYTNWRQINSSWPDTTITTFGRENTAGTYDFVKSKVMKNENFSQSVSQETGDQQIISKVRQTEGGIGYVVIGFAKQAEKGGQANIIHIRNNNTSIGYLPTDADAVYNGSYTLWRYLFLYSAGRPTGCVNDWVGFVLSQEGQKIVNDTGFYPLPLHVLTQMNDRLNGTASNTTSTK